jgi:uncharacterized protein
VDCAEDDPYSYRIHVILPANGDRFGRSAEFRRFAEQVIRQEIPAHVLPKICWLDRTQLIELQTAYKELLLVRAAQPLDSSAERDKLRTLVDVLYHVKSVYTEGRLGDCAAPESKPKFVLGRTRLGSQQSTENE